MLLPRYEVGLQVTYLYLFYFSHLLIAENYAFSLAEGVGEPGLVEFYVRELTHFFILRGEQDRPEVGYVLAHRFHSLAADFRL